MIKIAFFDTHSYEKDSFNKNADENISITFFEMRLSKQTVNLCKGYDAVCVFVNDDVSKEVVNHLYENGVKLIALRCAGYNNVDLTACFGKIHVVHVPAYSPNAVAEHTMALLLTSIRRIHKAYNRTRDYNFSLEGMMGFNLNGKTVGVIGTGRIGRVFTDICKGFGMNVLAYDKFPNESYGLNYVSLETLFKESDIISLHCPLTDETKHLINSDSIKMMKKGVVILNTSRGGLLDAEALLEGIKERKIGAACLDVYEEESDIFFSDKSGHILNDEVLARLISMPNVIVTSHQAFLTNEALDNIAETTIENINSYFNNDEPIKNELCYCCGNMDRCRKEKKAKCF